MSRSFLILGDQLSRNVIPPWVMEEAATVLLMENRSLVARPGHLTRTALYLSALRQFAEELRQHGYRVDYRVTSSFSTGLADHVAEYSPTTVVMHRPHGRRAQTLFARCGVQFLPSPFFLTDIEAFAARRYSTMEAFYRDQRRIHEILMEAGEPVGGRWNFDELNRQPLPKDGGTWPTPWSWELSPDETALVRELSATHPGADALAYWPRTREQALAQLDHAVTTIVPLFGPYEDAASTSNWHLAHTRLSVALNLGLLLPGEVVDAVVREFDAGRIPLPSAEGFLRQIIGWREWVWALHQIRDADYPDNNFLGATNPVPSTWRELDEHPMVCLSTALRHLHDFGWTHHIERLMIMTNAATLAGLRPRDVARWMEITFVDGAEWVMEANVIGMGMFADGGATATKPYIAGGNYIKKMTDCCRTCAFQPTERATETACPLTTLYWTFFLDHSERLAGLHRIAPQRRAAEQRPDRVEILQRSDQARRIVRGEISTASHSTSV
ncbi:MAG: cryptochrome/photolyase family protein [Acidobacteria bacterium]|nr:cryptochrome/photolyase family protein [Acidobacteriota bacterium]